MLWGGNWLVWSIAGRQSCSAVLRCTDEFVTEAETRHEPLLFSQIMVQKEPEKTMPSTAANAIILAKLALVGSHHLSAQFLCVGCMVLWLWHGAGVVSLQGPWCMCRWVGNTSCCECFWLRFGCPRSSQVQVQLFQWQTCCSDFHWQCHQRLQRRQGHGR